MPFFQAKLTVNQPGDAHEQEADRVADQVMRMKDGAAPFFSPSQGAQRGIQRMCSGCAQEEKDKADRKETGGQAGGQAAPAIVSTVLSSNSGQPLDGGTRQFMETRMGQDFSQVRVHTDAQAAESAQAIQARAYTSGRDVVFGSGEYQPGSEAGKRLLAHELVHVGQQSSQNAGLIQRDTVSDAAGNVIAYRFRSGTELTLTFLNLAHRLTRDGSLNDRDLRQLRNNAIIQRGTLNDHERMFMAGLLDPANVATFNATVAGANFQFPAASITMGRLNHLNNLDRNLPQSLQTQMDEVTGALLRVDAVAVLKELGETEAAARQSILNNAGPWRQQASLLLNFITTNHITATATIGAMVNAASDNSVADRLMAGMVYAIAVQASHPLTSMIANGSIKVDALIPSAMAALPGFNSNVEAAYVTVAQGGGAKGDTMYVKTTINPENLFHRSTVIHELRHAQDEDRKSTRLNSSHLPTSRMPSSA